jgi:hypothetical protein
MLDLSNRAADHFMIQYGADSWTNRPDSVRTGGFSRHFNFYFMFDKPFKTNPKAERRLWCGIGSSNMFFKNTRVDIKSNTPNCLLPMWTAPSFQQIQSNHHLPGIPVELGIIPTRKIPMFLETGDRV